MNAEDDLESRVRSRLTDILKLVLRVALVLLAVVALIDTAVEGPKWTLLAMIAGVMSTVALLLAFANRGQPRLTAIGTIGILLVLVIGAVLLRGTTRIAAPSVFIFAAALAGLFLERTAVIVTLCASAIVLAALTYAESAGLLAPEAPGSLWALFVGIVALSIITALVLFNARKIVLQALRRSQEELGKRRTTEFALRNSEQRLRGLTELSSDAFWESDSTHRITKFEPSSGYPLTRPYESLIGKARWETGQMQPGDPRGWVPLREVMDRQEVFRDFEVSMESIAGEVRWYAISGEPLHSPDGGFLGYRGVTQEVTGRKREQEALAASEARFRAVFERSTAGMATWGLDGRFLTVNSAFCEFVGYSANELVGKMSAGELREPGDEEGLNLTGRMLLGEIPHITRDRRYRRRDGSTVWGRTTVAGVRGKEGALQYFVAVVIDITEAREASERIQAINAALDQRVQERTIELQTAVERLKEVNQDLDSFNYSVSHDLRQPLGAIAGFSDLLRENVAGTMTAQALEFAREIETNAFRMDQMIQALSRFASAGSSELRITDIDMRRLVESVLRDLTPSARPHVDISVGDLPPAHGDEELLRHVWTNLIANALKYSSKNPAPKIDLSGMRRDGALEYVVRDNGVGFDMHDAARMFGVFERLPTSAGFEGTGVGLAIVQRIVRRHGGQISAESAPGQGATFRFTLPK